MALTKADKPNRLFHMERKGCQEQHNTENYPRAAVRTAEREQHEAQRGPNLWSRAQTALAAALSAQKRI